MSERHRAPNAVGFRDSPSFVLIDQHNLATHARITKAYAAVEPTNPLPTPPIFGELGK